MFKEKEGLDYNVGEQIQYTQEKYINKIIKQLKGEPMVLEYIYLNLKFYSQINKITLDDLQRGFAFSDVVSNIINKKNK